MEIVVDLRNVTKRFGDFVAVSNVSFKVKRGEFFSLLGPSGCGKTTTLRMISGFEKTSEGEIYIRGKSMKDIPPFMRPTNLVFQNLALFPHKNVYDNIAFGLRMKKVPKDEVQKKVKEMLRIVRLPGVEKRKIRQLSGGEQQRIALVRALVNQPEVLLLDEPLGPLDLKLRQEMQEELKRIQREVGTSFIYVTHDQGEALNMSDRVAVMNEGKIEQIGTVTEVYEKPKTRFVARFIGDSNLIEGTYIDSIVKAKGLEVKVGPCPLINNDSPALVVIKPEKIFIGRNLEGLDNIFDGQIEDVSYVGHDVTYKVALEEDFCLKVLAQNVNGRFFKPRERLKVGWKIENCCVLRQRL